MQISLKGNRQIGRWDREVQGYGVNRNWVAMFAVTLRMHRRLVICRLYVSWMQIPFGVIKQLEVGLVRFKVVMLGELAIKWGG